MDEAAFELLENLAGHALGRLRLLRSHTPDDTVKAAFALAIVELEDLLEKARHEQKGGAG